MSDIITLKLSSIHGIIAALVFLVGGGGFLAAIRRSGRQATTETDPEAVELVVAGTVDGGITFNADASE